VAVIGDRRKFLVALIVPAFEALADWAHRRGIADVTPAGLVKNPEVRKKYHEIVEKFNSEFGRVEQIKEFALLDVPFTQESGELTPTLKVKRRVVEQKYRDVIESLYLKEN
jgi:long-chain acyl-CoA synthetase